MFCNWITVMVVELCEYTKTYQIVHNHDGILSQQSCYKKDVNILNPK